MRLAAAVPWLLLAAVGAAAVAGPVAASPYGLLDGLQEPLAYCDGTPGADALGAVTDAAYRGPVTEAPLPASVTQRRLTVDGVTTRVLQSGPATADEAVVFVHGNPDSARDWDALVASTGRFGRAVAFDMPGYGRADDRRGLDYSTTGAARFIGRVVERLGIHRVHLVGHDFGGIWGLQWAIGDLAALRSVTLLDSGVLIGATPHPTALTFSTPPAGEAFMAATTRDAFKAVIESQNPLPDPFLDRLYDDYDRATRCAILHYYRSIDSADDLGRRQAPILRHADVPALAVWGQRDPYTPVALASRQTQAFPHARIEILPKIGHWPQVEAPAQTDRLVTGFLRGLVRMPRLIATVLRARAGDRRLSVRVRVTGATRTPAVRLRLRRGGQLVGAAPARTVDDVARRVAIALRRPLRRGRYTLELRSAELPRQTRVLQVR